MTNVIFKENDTDKILYLVTYKQPLPNRHDLVSFGSTTKVEYSVINLKFNYVGKVLREITVYLQCLND